MSDEELIGAWKAGDNGSAAVLVERHSKALLALAFSFGVREEAEELVQDVFVRAFAAIHSFRGDRAAFRTWLATIMRRLILDRARARRRADEMDCLDSIAESQPASIFGALDEIVAAETERRICAAIPADDLPLVRMRLAGRSWRAVADALGSKEATVKVRFHRIRKALREVAA